MQHMQQAKQYVPFERVNLPDRQWPDKIITKASNKYSKLEDSLKPITYIREHIGEVIVSWDIYASRITTKNSFSLADILVCKLL